MLRRRRLAAIHARTTSEGEPAAVEKMWRDAAEELGAEATRLSPTLMEFRLGRSTARVAYLATTPFTDPVSRELASDKPLAYRLLAEAGVPVPEHVVVDSVEDRRGDDFLAGSSAPLLVKPARGAGGSGVVGHIRTVPQLRAALRSALVISPDAIVEKLVAGTYFRLLFLDGVLLDVLRRSFPGITGDGAATIETLMFREYERRIAAGGDAAGYKRFDVDLDCLFTLRDGGYGLRDVLPAGETIMVKTATNYSDPADTEVALGEVGEEVVDAARLAAQTLGVRLAGVDVVTADPTRPLREVGGVVLEVNPVPGLPHHYNIGDPDRATRVAVPILAALLNAGAGDARDGAVGATTA